MPGLIGFYSESIESGNAVENVKKMQDLITHKSFYEKDTVFSKSGIQASRSHINVTQKGTQPASKKSVYIWLDGEFHNSKELNRVSGEDISSDAEILLELYLLKPDLTFLKDIDGGYSAVIFDERKNKLFLITDRYCRQHLYWSKFRDGIAWSSEIKAFSALTNFNLEIDPLAVEDFIGTGSILGERTWLNGVNLMPASSVMTVDLNNLSVNISRYWWWNQLSVFNEELDLKAVAEETGILLEKAVEEHYNLADGNVGIALSGGKDSRAILAAIPDNQKTLQAFTFGKKNSLDIVNATRAAKIKNANHHVYELNDANWFEERLDSIWWTDGLTNLIHLNAIGDINRERKLFNNVFIGLGGEAISGRSHLFDKENIEDYLVVKYSNEEISNGLFNRLKNYLNEFDTAEIYYFDHRFRNFSVPGLKRGECSGVRTRAPLLNNRLMEFVYRIPYEYKASSRLYDQMLIMKYPEIFSDLSWNSKGLDTISAHKRKYYSLKIKRRLMKFLSRIGLAEPVSKSFTDYPAWIRTEPAATFIRKIFQAEDAIYPDYLDKQEVLSCFELHLQGEDKAVKLCRYLTFEIWLQQLFRSKYRSNEEYRSLIYGEG